MKRIIHAENTMGEEIISIINDDGYPATDYFPAGFRIISETTIICNLPGSFPINSTFLKID